MQSMNISAASSATKGTPAISSPSRAERGLHERRADHAEGDAADRRRGERHDLVRALRRHAPREAPHRERRLFAGRIHHRGQDDRQQELHEADARAARLPGEPLEHLVDVRRDLREQAVGASRQEFAPRLGDAPADQRDALDPRGRRRQPSCAMRRTNAVICGT